MLQIFQEAFLPRLSETSFYQKFDSTSGITNLIKEEITQSSQTIITPDKITEVLSLIKLNGDSIAKMAVLAYQKGDIVIIHNPTGSKIPASLPYIIMNYKGKPTAFIFADKVVKNIASSAEYTNLMATLEAAFLALNLHKNPDMILMNAPLMLTLCNVYAIMATAPMEQRLYMKGDNLNKALMYTIAYFYRMFKGDEISAASIPFKRLMNDKIDEGVANQIVEEVKSLPDMSFLSVIGLVQKINPIRFKDLQSMYPSYFTTTCGVSLIFALENIQYLFLLMTAAVYKSSITAYGINKTVSLPSRKAIQILSSLSLK